MENASTAVKRRVNAAAITANYYFGNYRNVIWLVGDGRSGTTWLTTLLNADRRYREMFEPFHPVFVPEMKGFSLFQYIRPTEKASPHYQIAEKVFSGKLRYHRVDEANCGLWYDGLLIKDIFANLFLGWAHRRFPHVKKLLVLRHPFAVALSKSRLQSWRWMTEPMDFLKQHSLRQDYLMPFEDVICNARSYFEKQIVIWCIIHYVPFMQLEKRDIGLVFYEELCNRPDMEIEHIGLHLGIEYRSNVGLDDKLSVPSRVSRADSAINTGKSLTDWWRSELSRAQIDRGLAILNAFGLDKIYNENTMPNRKKAENLLGAGLPKRPLRKVSALPQ